MEIMLWEHNLLIGLVNERTRIVEYCYESLNKILHNTNLVMEWTLFSLDNRSGMSVPVVWSIPPHF